MPDGSITSRDVLDELREFRRDTNERLNVLQNTLATMATTVAVEQTHRQAMTTSLDKQATRLDEHDRRIRGLSRWRWLAAGGVATALALGAVGGPEAAQLVGG